MAWTAEMESARSAEASWRDRPVTPSRRADDVSRLRVSIRDVVIVVGACVAMYAAQLGAQWGLRSDVRDILTRMEAEAKINDVKAKLQDERLGNLRDAIQAMQRRTELQQYEIQRLNETILKRK